MVPIGMMIAAPLAVAVHSIDVAIDLGAVIAMTRGVVVDAGAGVFEASVAGIAVVGLRVQRASYGKKQAAG